MIRRSHGTPIAIGAGLIWAVIGSSARAESIDLPDARAFLSATASGVQIYACEYGSDHALGWVFRQPRATLYDANGAAVIAHSTGPSWEARDGSRIEGDIIAQKPSDMPGSVPQLLLRARSTGAQGLLASARYVQRVKTVGGVKPTAPCTVQHQPGSSPYIATYLFYR
ncbi:DUF3455 domain-containing protein [Paraburkholderia sp. CNPSo 3157]|uniref:DUF3455 domain-containing protein n=1 Tax=Paraburkholderia franconis TaxID=2654983 RepID=A0A7X1THJ6_9BURK|nr:DUF3455 domain-containing protein [Paraburkholderia franconis]MPW19391.1 DUF3455 domain-containing protein [Paraburkholderia franconis]